MEAEPEFPSVQAKDVLPTILCCLCGTRIQSNPSNMCVNCLRHQVDITAGISKQVTLFFCRGCGRYQRPPWVSCELESRELLALCLKKIKGLNKDVKLVDAGFIWTEPHSKRIKVKCTIQKEVHGGAIMQQTFVVEFVVTNQQCTDCQKSFTENTWNTVIQLRQKVKHKRTFFWLEQLLLKHNVVEKCFSVKEQPEGLDFYWNHKNQAMQMINFLNSVVPIRWQQAKRLVATDIQSNIETYKFTLNVEIVPICRDDLVLLPPKLATALGGSSPLLVCVKVTSALHLLDPFSLKHTEVNADKYWRAPFQPLMNSRQLVEFVVLDVQKESPNHNNPNGGGKYALAEVTCAKTSDFGVNDKQYEVICHLGHFLKPGDYVLGYDLGGANLSESASTALKNREMPEIVLIKKTYPEQKKNRNKNRRFKLRHLKKEVSDHAPKKHEVKKMEEDYENFLNDIEEDPEMRKEINLYRREKMGANAGAAASSADDETKGDEDVPEVGLDELLEDLEQVGISQEDAEDSGMAPVESEADLNDLDESDLPPFVATSKPN